jgi:hypothetical protein
MRSPGGIVRSYIGATGDGNFFTSTWPPAPIWNTGGQSGRPGIGFVLKKQEIEPASVHMNWVRPSEWQHRALSKVR